MCQDDFISGFNLIPDGCITDGLYSHSQVCSTSSGNTEYELFPLPNCVRGSGTIELGHSGHRKCNFFDDDYDDDFFDDDVEDPRKSAAECCSVDSSGCSVAGVYQPSSRPTVSPKPESQKSNSEVGLSTGEVVGAAVGGFCGAILIAALFVFYLKRRSSAQKQPMLKSKESSFDSNL
jgi:hypothetical protein